MELLSTDYYVYGICFLSFAFLAHHYSEGRKLSHIPTVGYNNPILSYITAIRFFWRSHDILLKARDEHSSSVVKVPVHNGWYLVANNQHIIDEIKRLPEDVFSFDAAIQEGLHNEYTLGNNIAHDPYHVPIVRNQLTRNIGKMLPYVHDEVLASFKDIIPPSAEWVRYPLMDTLIKIIARTSNRTFVGLPLCRNPEYLKIGTNFTSDVMKVVLILDPLPSFLRPIAGRLFSRLRKRIRQANEHLGPIINERRKRQEDHKYNPDTEEMDFLTWLMEKAAGDEQSTENLTSRILMMNFASIHTTSLTLTQLIFDVAAHPEYIQPLLEEIDAVIKDEGLTKNALDKMKLLDSFVKESQRLRSITILTAVRKSMIDYTFSDGTFIPRGTKIAVSTSGRHYDDNLFTNADKFDAFRFTKEKQDENEGPNRGPRSDADLLAFGIGKHICPGRHFAMSSMKLILIHLLMFYDVKLEDGKQRPTDIIMGVSRIPNPRGALMIRSRKSSKVL